MENQIAESLPETIQELKRQVVKLIILKSNAIKDLDFKKAEEYDGLLIKTAEKERSLKGDEQLSKDWILEWFNE